QRVLADLATNNGADPAYAAWRGYSLFTTLGANTSGTLTARARTGASDAIVGTAAHTAVGVSIAAPSLLNATTHLGNILTITRTATGVTVRGRIAGVPIEVADSMPAATRFDAFSLWAHPGPLGSNGRLRLDNLTVEKSITPAVPSAPAQLTAAQTALGQIRLDWLAPVPAPLGYRLERAGPDGVWLFVAALPSAATTYLDTTLTPGATHTYRLIAYGEAGPAATAPELALLADTPHRAWRRTHFATPENTGPAANLADPDADGLVNLLEYALSTAPLSPGTAPNVRVTNIEPALQIEFLRARTDLTYEVLASSTLEPDSWQVIATNPGVVSDTTPVVFTDPVSVSPRRFLRLHVTAPVSP
ncbi:MAG: fibronectin type III domain-containing protein, partial [Burkholderiales bacterium]|nr:fibronectin type III domain-containing protein [Opitutaceae bacterium]